MLSIVIRIALCAAAIVGLLGGCAASGEDRAGSGPLITFLDSGGNSVDRPRRAPAVWSATFGSLLLCSPERVTITGIEPRYRYGKPASIEFFLRTVPGVADRHPGRQIAWAPVGTSTEPPATLVETGALRYATLGPALGAQVDQPCAEGADVPFTEILTAVNADAGGVWIKGLDIHYVADGRDYSLPVNWAYVACGDLIEHTEVC